LPPGTKLLAGYAGPNAATLEHLNKLLTQLYKAKDPTITHARLGISGKASRRISVLLKTSASTQEVNVAPTLSHLSSGEFLAFSLACSILREYDLVNRRPPATLDDVSGVVLIDEVDLHLHIQLQREVLPTLLHNFPKLQFIVTTHSPFFLIGLNEIYGPKPLVYRLPHGTRIAPEDFEEFEHAYEIFSEKNQQFKQAYDAVNEHLRAAQRPLVVTEGKTDWMHLKHALAQLNTGGQFTELDIDLLEYDRDMGHSELKSMCEHFAKVPQDKKAIFIFDRDEASIIDSMTDDNVGYKAWGNNVYSFCIPKPPHRALYNRISIEFYYTDEELRTVDPDSNRRLFFSNELEERQTASLTTKLRTKSFLVRAEPVVEEEFEKFVFSRNCDLIIDAQGNQAAISKTVFATKVLNHAPSFAALNADHFALIFQKIDAICGLP
jgi:hypothetical protein